MAAGGKEEKNGQKGGEKLINKRKDIKDNINVIKQEIQQEI